MVGSGITDSKGQTGASDDDEPEFVSPEGRVTPNELHEIITDSDGDTVVIVDKNDNLPSPARKIDVQDLYVSNPPAVSTSKSLW